MTFAVSLLEFPLHKRFSFMSRWASRAAGCSQVCQVSRSCLGFRKSESGCESATPPSSCPAPWQQCPCPPPGVEGLRRCGVPEWGKYGAGPNGTRAGEGGFLSVRFKQHWNRTIITALVAWLTGPCLIISHYFLPSRWVGAEAGNYYCNCPLRHTHTHTLRHTHTRANANTNRSQWVCLPWLPPEKPLISLTQTHVHTSLTDYLNNGWAHNTHSLSPGYVSREDCLPDWNNFTHNTRIRLTVHTTHVTD